MNLTAKNEVKVDFFNLISKKLKLNFIKFFENKQYSMNRKN